MRGFNIGYNPPEKPSSAKKWLGENTPCNPPKGYKGKVRSPSITNIPKWKSDLLTAMIGLKWRDFIAYTKFIFRPWARLIGRCLQLCVNQLCHTRQGLGFLCRLGIRERAFAIQHLSQQTGSAPFMRGPECVEKDMDTL